MYVNLMKISENCTVGHIGFGLNAPGIGITETYLAAYSKDGATLLGKTANFYSDFCNVAHGGDLIRQPVITPFNLTAGDVIWGGILTIASGANTPGTIWSPYGMGGFNWNHDQSNAYTSIMSEAVSVPGGLLTLPNSFSPYDFTIYPWVASEIGDVPYYFDLAV
jgi:hypothetical protein